MSETPDEIIKAIKKEFECLEDFNFPEQDLRTRTRGVLTALCKAGRQEVFNQEDLSIELSASRVDTGTEWGEWLYDVVWSHYCPKSKQNGNSNFKNALLKSIPMVAECEWGDFEDIKEDFEKLLVARAAVRVMVYDGRKFKGGAEAGAEQLCEWISAFEGGQEGDTYLLIAYEENATREGWGLHYYILYKAVAGKPGQKPECDPI